MNQMKGLIREISLNLGCNTIAYETIINRDHSLYPVCFLY